MVAKRGTDKVWIYVIVLVAIILVMVFAFKDRIGLSPESTRNSPRNALQPQDASTLIKNAVASQDTNLINAIISKKASQLIDKNSPPVADPKILEAFSVKGGNYNE